MLERFIRSEARSIAGDLEQYAVRLAEIEAAEIEAIDRPTGRNALLPQTIGPAVIVRIGRTERNMVHATRALLRRL